MACKLEEIFGVVCYPKIMHSDNGKEFRAKIVLELLHNLNPNIILFMDNLVAPKIRVLLRA